MILYPAVDIQNGKAVRLKQGRAQEFTIFDQDPVHAAKLWESRGARRLHVVDLDGAFDGAAKNRPIVQRICESLDIPIQLGGGIRSEAVAAAYLETGVSRLIIGTLALEQPDLFARLCEIFPGKVGVSLDAAGGRLKSRGWVADTGLTVDEALPRLLEAGAAFVIYTDIERDGMQSGVNLKALEHLAEISSVPVIAAGGVATLADVQKLYPLTLSTRLEGAVSGRALYEGTLNLEEANAWIDARSKKCLPDKETTGQVSAEADVVPV
ncbi:MAG: 1-(5-phosphoribosyl)-5-[(5-phosphoribosylamino)methylideneamino]imidazole-4-carboxamide isomerase [Desulfovibrio sp.]|nr:1-(5-phosphoribosyl)-5-[(5-phosphoribosylamino)methylideneamino]imidazole-4-carboxamide isomerase [Desulfovibrio sp.]